MPSIRQQINIHASQRAVWRALTTAEGLTSWWVDEARVDAREGGRITIVSEDDEGNPIEESGVFHKVRPTRKIEIKFDSVGKGENAGTRVEFSLGRDGDDTRVALVHSGSGPLDDEEARSVMDKAWKGALKALRSSLEG